jgi:hypothetical protein
VQEAEAIRAFNLMSNGMGGIDWNALPLAVVMYGVHDVEALIDRLMIIKTHKPHRGED